MSGLIDSLEREQMRKVPPFLPGDRARVHFQVVEGSRRRTQVFEGIVLKRQGSGVRETFTVRKVSFGVGVERTFPVHSPKVERIEVVSRGEVRRAKLYYLRDRVGRAARVRERRFTGAEAELLALADEPDMADAEGTQDEALPEDVAPPETDESEGAEAPTDAAPVEDSAAQNDAGADQPDAEPVDGEQGEESSEPDSEPS